MVRIRIPFGRFILSFFFLVRPSFFLLQGKGLDKLLPTGNALKWLVTPCCGKFSAINVDHQLALLLCMYGHTYSKSMDQPGKVASPARGQLDRENEYFPVRVRA